MNPLRIDNKPGGDTRYLVRTVLTFMSEAFEALETQQDALSKGAMMGASQIMHMCVDALREEEEGPADGG